MYINKIEVYVESKNTGEFKPDSACDFSLRFDIFVTFYL